MKKCVLTVKLPNRQTRTYTTAPVYFRKVEAKFAASLVAVKNHVVEFMEQAARDMQKSSTTTTPQVVSDVQQPSTLAHIAEVQVPTLVPDPPKKKKKKKKPLPKELSPERVCPPRTQDLISMEPAFVQIEDCCKAVKDKGVSAQWYTTCGQERNVGHIPANADSSLMACRINFMGRY